MAIKGDDQPERLVLAGIAGCLTNDLLMAQVHPVKKSNRQANPMPGRTQFAQGVNDSHNLEGLELAIRIMRRYWPLSFKNGMTSFSNSRVGSFITSSNSMALATSNLPDFTRLRVERCAPHPIFWPSSCETLRT